MSRTSVTGANAQLAAPRKLLDDYLREATSRLARRRQVVGDRIREAREAKGWLQKTLAARVHVEPQTVSNWERGVSTPDLEKLEMVARELGQPLAYFVSEEPVSQPVVEATEEARDLRILVDALVRHSGLDPEQILRDGRLQPEEPEPGAEDLEAPGEAA